MADLNASHKKNWDTIFNTAGTTLLCWANLHNWVIRAANLPYFYSIQGSSNIDLFFTKVIRVTEAQEVAFGPWHGCCAITWYVWQRTTYILLWNLQKNILGETEKRSGHRKNKAIFVERAACTHCAMRHTAVPV